MKWGAQLFEHEGGPEIFKSQVYIKIFNIPRKKEGGKDFQEEGLCTGAQLTGTTSNIRRLFTETYGVLKSLKPDTMKKLRKDNLGRIGVMESQEDLQACSIFLLLRTLWRFLGALCRQGSGKEQCVFLCSEMDILGRIITKSVRLEKIS